DLLRPALCSRLRSAVGLPASRRPFWPRASADVHRHLVRRIYIFVRFCPDALAAWDLARARRTWIWRRVGGRRDHDRRDCAPTRPRASRRMRPECLWVWLGGCCTVLWHLVLSL